MDHDVENYTDTCCDIHVLDEGEGQRLEISNVNNTQVEHRMGTDLIYSHEPAHSLVLFAYLSANTTPSRSTASCPGMYLPLSFGPP